MERNNHFHRVQKPFKLCEWEWEKIVFIFHAQVLKTILSFVIHFEVMNTNNLYFGLNKYDFLSKVVHFKNTKKHKQKM